MRIMIVGELEGHGTEASKIALEQGAQVIQCASLEQALSSLRAGKGCDIALVDVNLDIKDFINSLKNERFHLDVVGCGVKPDPKKAASAIRAGAKEYIPLPPDPLMIASLLQTITHEETSIIAHDPVMKQVFLLADRISPSEANVLLTGASGTGKEILARYIHDHSKRCDKPFISINCAAIPENLLESELFGHEKGAFTGALARRIGKFEEANGGTLLLDEVTEMHPRLQAKLLRAIQERIIDRVGGDKPVKVNIRIIATSNRDMLEAIKAGDFREDLYYRLNVVNLKLPFLKDRPKDIIPLAQYFIKKYADLNQIPIKELSVSAEGALMRSLWQGNVRELENLMHRAVLLASDKIYPIDIFGEDYRDNSAPIEVENIQSLHDMEKQMIIKTLERCTGDKNNAAQILGISIRTLRNKLKEYEEANC